MECKRTMFRLVNLANYMASNDKATFYTDTDPSAFLRGRQSIVP